MRVGVLASPFTVDHHDMVHAVNLAGHEPVAVWHAEPLPKDIAGLVIPSGCASPSCRDAETRADTPAGVMVKAAGEKGLPILGIGTGFQLLCSVGLLDGEVTGRPRNLSHDELFKAGSVDTVWTCAMTRGQELKLAVRTALAYTASTKELLRLNRNDQVVLRYVYPPHDGLDIAGVTNEHGNVVGLIPHLQANMDPQVAASVAGRRFFDSLSMFRSNRA